MMRLKKSSVLITIVAGLVGCYFLWLFFFSGDVFYTHSRNSANRSALIRMQEKIKIGDSYENVLSVYWECATQDTQLHTNNPSTWSVSTPLEIGASNWVLYVNYVERKVKSVSIRTDDGPKPPDAPPDK